MRNNRERKQEHYKQLSSIIRCSTKVGKDLFQTCEAPKFLATYKFMGNSIAIPFQMMKRTPDKREAAALLYLIALLYQIVNKNKRGEERFRLATI